MPSDDEPPWSPPEIRPPGLIRRVRGHLLDLSALRSSPDLRRLTIAGSVSEFGNQATLVAIPFQVYAITGSTLAVGLIAALELVPRLVLAPIGGMLADSVDRRRLSLISNAVFALLSAGLVANALRTSPLLWPLYVFATGAGGVSALSVPSIRAWPARLVEPRLLPAAFAIEGATYNANALVGPAVAGVLIAVSGIASAYLLDVVTFVIATVALWGMHASRPAMRTGRLASIREGLAIVRNQRIVRTLLGLDFVAMFFGMPFALFPALVSELRVGPSILGLLYAAPAAGGLVAAGLSGGLGRLRHPGRGVVVALCVWSASLVVMGLADAAWLVWLAFAVAGGANELSAVLGNSIMQAVVPDDVRGRLAAIDDAVSTAGPALGDVESGVVATWIGVGPTIVFGGVLAAAGVVVLAFAGGTLRAYRFPGSPDPQPG
jgi:MFS family permease